MRTSQDKEPEFEFTARIELFLISAMVFGRRFLTTIFDLAVRPYSFVRNILTNTMENAYVKPITFLTVITYLNVKALRLLVLFFMVLLGSLERTCALDSERTLADESLANGFEQFFLERIGLPSFEEVIAIGLPILAGVLVFCLFLRVLLVRSDSSCKNNITLSVCYTVSFLYLIITAWLVLFGGLVSANTSLGNHFTQELFSLIYKNEPWFIKEQIRPPRIISTLSIIGSGLHIWASFLLYLMLHKLIPIEERRVKQPWIGHFYIALMSASTIIGSTALGLAVSYPATAFENKKLTSEPFIAMTAIKCSQNENTGITIDVLVRNNSHTSRYVLVNHDGTSYRERNYGNNKWKSFGNVEFYSENSTADVIALIPGQAIPLKLKIKPTEKRSISDNDENRQNSIQYYISDGAGTLAKVVSTIRLPHYGNSLGEELKLHTCH